jgi:sugar phosphate isomerase/epimerase
MVTRYDLGPFGLGDEMRFLRDFSGELIVTGSGGPRGLEGRDLKAAVQAFVERMKPHVELAAKLGVKIGIENHAASLIASLDSLRYFRELVVSPHLGIALAPYHLPQEPALLARLVEDLGPRLVHFYAWQHGKGCMKKLPKAEELEQLPGRGKLDFEPLLRSLRKIGYAGWTEIFMHPVPRGTPILETTAEVTAEVDRSKKHLEKLLARIEATAARGEREEPGTGLRAAKPEKGARR